MNGVLHLLSLIPYARHAYRTPTPMLPDLCLYGVQSDRWRAQTYGQIHIPPRVSQCLLRLRHRARGHALHPLRGCLRRTHPREI